MNQNYCINCGKVGHYNKTCNDPITSYGIICFHINNIPLYKIEQFLYNKFIEIEDFNYKYLNYIKKINKYKNNIKFLLIQRKHSLSYLEFMRGKYNETKIEEIKYLCSLMSFNELEDIKNKDFQLLWDMLWLKTARNKIFLKEMNASKKKYEFLKCNNILSTMKTEYKTPEWGFPKGRRNKYEKNMDCAIREFIEETNFKNFNLLDRINVLEETFLGTNNIPYKHIYYLGGTQNKELNIMEDNYEVGDIKWCNINETINLLRIYDKTKINLINQLYFFLTIILEKINDKKITNNNNNNKLICNI